MVHAGVYSMHGQPMVTHYHPGMPMPGYPGAPPMYPAYGYMQVRAAAEAASPCAAVVRA